MTKLRLHPEKITKEQLEADDLYGDKVPPTPKVKVTKVTLYNAEPVVEEPGKNGERPCPR